MSNFIKVNLQNLDVYKGVFHLSDIGGIYIQETIYPIR